MNKKTIVSAFAILLSLTIYSNSALAVPKITGTPHIVSPNLLSWPSDHNGVKPNLTEPTANRLNDLHGQIADCDLVLSTAGNYHMALRELWLDMLANNKDVDIDSWYYTTSPPISPKQVPNSTVQFGNLKLNCVPQVAVGPKKLMKKLANLGVIEGRPVKILKNYGNVLLVKKGNPKNIHSVWDLARNDVTLVTPNPKMEAGSFGNFSGTVYNVAKNDANPPANMTAEKLFDKVFNSDQTGCGTASKKCSWVSGKRIMHREQPWAVFSDNADAGLIFYHLALYFTRTFPDQFEIVPLGGTANNPKPVKGNKVGVLQAVRIKGNWSKNQLKARELLMESFQSKEFTKALKSHGIRRP